MDDLQVKATDEPNREELRLYRRYAVDGSQLQVSWLDKNGAMRVTSARAVNVCEDGIAFELPDAAMPLMVRFQSDQFDVKGAGVVRHCSRVGRKYVIGVKFTGGLNWRAPEGDIREPIPLCSPEPGKQVSLLRFLRKVTDL